MTRTPDHGTRARYLRGCHCQPCTNAHYSYMSRWRLDDQRGIRRRTAAAPAIERAQKLTTLGWTQQQIADAAGTSRRTVQSLLLGTVHRVSIRSATGVLAITPGPPPAGPRDVDATGTIRRLRALVAIGHPIARIAPHVGIHCGQLARIARGERSYVRAETASAVADTYRTWNHRPGTSARARTIAARRGWQDPQFWEDYDAIDDPDFDPTVALEAEQPAPRYIRLAEDWAWLEQQGYTRAQAADRLGVSRDNLEACIRRASRRYGVAA